ncbi:microtubule-associated serine/threonine-protein kinase 3-like [Ranitomeya variabilis]|uniref:microtubule-associated serine/threonine-protein kinase 3-like n=1 Tax=Ranitomeya variabilis TaxID=490064 RepID=UPI004057CBBF
MLSNNTDDITWKFNNSAPPHNAQDIITKLLRKDPALRLGTGGANEIKIHPFFFNLDFENFLSQKPLFIPDFKSEEDTSYFNNRSGKYKHKDSNKWDTSEDNDWPESKNFVSSSKRLSKLCSINTEIMNNEEPKSPPECSPDTAKHSDMQKNRLLLNLMVTRSVSLLKTAYLPHCQNFQFRGEENLY